MTEELVAEIGREASFTQSAQAVNFVCGALMAYEHLPRLRLQHPARTAGVIRDRAACSEGCGGHFLDEGIETAIRDPAAGGCAAVGCVSTEDHKETVDH
jgi:hypothetical protein